MEDSLCPNFGLQVNTKDEEKEEKDSDEFWNKLFDTKIWTKF